MKKRKLRGTITLEGHEGHISRAPRKTIKEVQAAAKVAFKRGVKVNGDLGGSDAPFIERVGIPTLGFGPIAEKSNYHGVNEYITRDDLERVKSFVKALITR